MNITCGYHCEIIYECKDIIKNLNDHSSFRSFTYNVKEGKKTLNYPNFIIL